MSRRRSTQPSRRDCARASPGCCRSTCCRRAGCSTTRCRKTPTAKSTARACAAHSWKANRRIQVRRWKPGPQLKVRAMRDTNAVIERLHALFLARFNIDVPTPDTDLLETGLLDSLQLVELLL